MLGEGNNKFVVWTKYTPKMYIPRSTNMIMPMLDKVIYGINEGNTIRWPNVGGIDLW